MRSASLSFLNRQFCKICTNVIPVPEFGVSICRNTPMRSWSSIQHYILPDTFGNCNKSHNLKNVPPVPYRTKYWKYRWKLVVENKKKHLYRVLSFYNFLLSCLSVLREGQFQFESQLTDSHRHQFRLILAVKEDWLQGMNERTKISWDSKLNRKAS